VSKTRKLVKAIINRENDFMRIGCHVSIAGKIWQCFERAEETGSEVFQIFTQNQRQWKSVQYAQEDVQTFHELRRNGPYHSVPLVAHASYLINLCASDEEKLAKSRQAFVDELKRCDLLGIDYLVIHPGSHGGNGEQWGMEKVAETLRWSLQQYTPKVQILLETTAGQGSNLGYRFEQLQSIIEQTQADDKINVCVDTCHIWAAGYGLETPQAVDETLNAFERIIGLERLKVWHFNDAKVEKGSKKDRHAPIGEGTIGLEAFSYLMNHPYFADHPAILEIPGGMEKFKENIALLKSVRK
jgi:deoxyribonuclease-4